MKKFIFAFLVIMITGSSQSQTFGEIHGKVLMEDGSTLPGAMVSASDGVNIQGTSTDIDGRFKIKPLTPGLYTLKYMYQGMETVTMQNVEVDPDEIYFADAVVMVPVGNTKPLVIEGQHHLIDPEETGKLTMRYADLKNMASSKGGNISAMVKNFSSDIKTDRDGELYFRGSRAGDVIYFIDGVKVKDAHIRMPSSGISAMSVYTGGVPAKYGDTTGGVVVIQTKNYLEDYYRKMNR